MMKATVAVFLILAFGVSSGPAEIPLPQGENPDGRLAAASPSKKKGKEKERPAAKRTAEDFRQRGAELENYVYEVFDPNAKDPLADLGLPAELRHGGRKWWIIGGGAALVGAGVAGYMLFFAHSPEVKKTYLIYTD
jgi:hypothetical protein